MTPETTAAVISATVSLIVLIVSPVLKSSLDSFFLIFKLNAEHAYEQKKQIRNILSKNKVHLMNASEALNSRLWNFSQNHVKHWHYVENYSEDLTNQNYFITFTYRLICFFAWQRKLDNEMIFLDTTIASKNDLIMIKYLRLFQQIMCDTNLFSGFDYDNGRATDHFFNNNFEEMVSAFISGDTVLSFPNYSEKLSELTPKILPIMNFINGINPDENRFRWEKLQILHLCVVAFLNTFGYDYQFTDKGKIEILVEIYKDNRLIMNFKELIVEYRLAKQKELRTILKVFDTIQISRD